MLTAPQNPKTGSVPVERRRHQRMKVVLLGRYMLPNRMEYPCQTTDISPGGLHMVAPAKPTVGDRVIVYLEHLGRIEGTAVRNLDGSGSIPNSDLQRVVANHTD